MSKAKKQKKMTKTSKLTVTINTVDCVEDAVESNEDEVNVNLPDSTKINNGMFDGNFDDYNRN